MKKQFSILIVDDVAENIDTLGEILKDYDIKVAINGKKALEIAFSSEPPDLILLDIIMPGKDGYAVCKELKEAKKTSQIPVIFITVMGEEADELKGFSLGAVDYITKPFSNATVRARVQTHLELKRHRDNLENIIQEKSDALIHNERLASRGVIAAAISHEINSPLAGVLQNIQIVKQRVSMEFPKNLIVAEELGIKLDDIHKYLEHRDVNKTIEVIYQSGQRVLEIIDNLLSFSRMDNAACREHSIENLLDQSIELTLNDYILNKQFSFEKLNIIKEYDSDVPVIMCNAERIKQVFHNIIKNGIQAMSEQSLEAESPCIIVRLTSDTGKICIEIEDNGPGMTKEVQEQLFEPFFSTRLDRQGTGLGGFVSYIIVTKNYNGTIDVESQIGKGTIFKITLPI